MSSRNTFVTSFIYWPEAIKVVRDVLTTYDNVNFDFSGDENHSGYFHGRIDTLSVAPTILLDILKYIADGFASLGYEIDFDIAIVCDDDKKVLHKLNPL